MGGPFSLAIRSRWAGFFEGSSLYATFSDFDPLCRSKSVVVMTRVKGFVLSSPASVIFSTVHVPTIRSSFFLPLLLHPARVSSTNTRLSRENMHHSFKSVKRVTNVRSDGRPP